MITRLAVIVIITLSVVSPALAVDTCRVFFKDKGLSEHDLLPGSSKFESAISRLSRSAIERRKHALGLRHDWQTIAQEDYDLDEAYLTAIQATGAQILHTSRWLNFATAIGEPDVIHRLSVLPFVERVVKPAFLKTIRAAEDCGADTIVFHRGLATWQLDRINTAPMHWLGIDASGVNIAYFDTGFIWRENAATDHLNVIGEYDFIEKDSITSQQEGDDPGQWGHGTAVLGVAAALLPDTTVGPAFGANIILGKTEDLRSETPREEENYALALEWAESLGARIASSSLGYVFFDSGFTSYTHQDLDGETAISSRAAARAAQLGMLIVTAAGNSGASAFPYVNAPADADSILAVGAYFFNDTIADFSSRGPTSDGRIKPDIAAPGVGVWTYDPTFNVPVPVTGTSHATPLVSAAAGLIMQAHPEATAQQVRSAIMQTGSQASAPDTMAGWGMLNTYAAALRLGPFFGRVTQKFTDNVLELCVGFASGAEGNSITFKHRRSDGAFSDIPLNEGPDSNYYLLSQFFGGTPGDTIQYYIVAATSDGDTLILPKGAPTVVYALVIGDSLIHFADVDRDNAMQTRANIFPNPAASFVEVTSDRTIVGAELLDVTGRSLATSPSETDLSKRFFLTEFASGSYLVKVLFADGLEEVHQLRIAR